MDWVNTAGRGLQLLRGGCRRHLRQWNGFIRRAEAGSCSEEVVVDTCGTGMGLYGRQRPAAAPRGCRRHLRQWVLLKRWERVDWIKGQGALVVDAGGNVLELRSSKGGFGFKSEGLFR